MDRKDLKVCWKCGKEAYQWCRTERTEYSGLVTCKDEDCMGDDENYTVDEWQSHPRPATREQLVEALRKARNAIEYFHGISGGISDFNTNPSILSEIDLLLAGEK